MAELAAIGASLVLLALAAFQAALIAGAPLGRFAWGGGHDRLPTPLRVGSGVSIALYALFAVVLLDRAGLTQLLPENTPLSVLAWGLAAYFLVGVVMNAVSRSRPERLVMTPTALFLSAASGVVAAS